MMKRHITGPLDAYIKSKKNRVDQLSEFAASATAKKCDYEESKRQRVFLDKWSTDFPWLIVSADRQKMFCSVCKIYEKYGTFSTGCSTMHRNSIRSHESSEGHVRNVLRHKAQAAKPGSTVAEKSLRKLTEKAFGRMVILFRNAHALAKHARPFTDFQWLCRLDGAKGIASDSMYVSDKQAAIFVHFIAKVEMDNIAELVEKAKFLSVISDGSTDSSYTEAEIIYVRFCHEGQITVKFIALKNVGKGDAATITQAILQALGECLGEDAKRKLVGAGTDGASVMTGRANGVVARIRREVGHPFLVGVHCAGHRLELSFKDGVSKCNMYQKVDAFLVGIYYFYRNSPLNRSNLKQSFKALHLPVLLPTRTGGTRWVGHHKRAISNLIRGYNAVRQHLQQVCLIYFI